MHVRWDVREALHIYKPTALPIAGRSLFLDIQVVTLLLKEFSCFNVQNLCYPTSRLCLYFSTIFTAHLRVLEEIYRAKREYILIILLSLFFFKKSMIL